MITLILLGVHLLTHVRTAGLPVHLPRCPVAVQHIQAAGLPVRLPTCPPPVQAAQITGLPVHLPTCPPPPAKFCPESITTA